MTRLTLSFTRIFNEHRIIIALVANFCKRGYYEFMPLPLGPNPYTTHEHLLLHERKYVRFFKDKVLIHGAEKDYSYIDVDDSVGIVALNERGEVALVGQWRYPIKEYRWEIPAGMAETGETPLENAKRELKEEAGVEAEDWLELGSYQMDGSKMNQQNHLFLARNLVVGENAPMEDEELAMKWLTLEEALSLVDSGEIRDGFTVIGLLKVQAYLQK